MNDDLRSAVSQLMPRAKQDLAELIAFQSVADESVARCVSDIRHALRDADQRFIKTVTKRGYMFVAPVSRHDEETRPSRSPVQWQTR